MKITSAIAALVLIAGCTGDVTAPEVVVEYESTSLTDSFSLALTEPTKDGDRSRFRVQHHANSPALNVTFGFDGTWFTRGGEICAQFDVARVMRCGATRDGSTIRDPQGVFGWGPRTWSEVR